MRVENAVDLHCHFHADHMGGGEIEVVDGVPAIHSAREAADNGYAALVLKPHGFASPALAHDLELAVPGIRLFGGICTDHSTGGLNVYAVELALSLGAKVVWLPTMHSTVDFHHFPMQDRFRALGPVAVATEDGELVPEVHEIFELVEQAGGLLATGHISLEEHHLVAEAFGRSGRIVVTHAGERAGPKLTPQQAAELADLGATVELTALNCRDVMGSPGKSPEEMVEYLRVVGPDRCALGTDYGYFASELPRPVPGYVEFLEGLWDLGVPEAD